MQNACSHVTFEGTCPFCGCEATEEVEAVISHSRKCSCGAIALGAPQCDFDEVIDDARNYFGVTVDSMTLNFRPPQDWLGECGIDLVEGGIGGPKSAFGANRFYWFKLKATVQ